MIYTVWKFSYNIVYQKLSFHDVESKHWSLRWLLLLLYIWTNRQNRLHVVRESLNVDRHARCFSFCPTDKKFVTCSDDSLVKIWDFYSCTEERAMRGHGAEVKCCDWHPQKGLIVSGSKDTQQPIKLWDPRVGQSLTTLYVISLLFCSLLYQTL